MTLIDFQTRDGIATLTLNRPDKMNAISDDLRIQLIDTLDAVSRDDSVCALARYSLGRWKGILRRRRHCRHEAAHGGPGRPARLPRLESGRCACTLRFLLLHHMPKSTIAAVNGAAAGQPCADMAAVTAIS